MQLQANILSSMIERIKTVRGWRRGAVAFAAGSLSVVAHAPFYIWPVLFLTFPVLVWLIDGLALSNEDASQNRWKLFKTAAVTGGAFFFGYFLFGLYWIGLAFLVDAGWYAVIMPFAMTLMPAGLSLVYAVALGLAALIWRPGFARILTLAIALTGAEWARGNLLTGFPWNMISYVFAGEAGLSQIFSLLNPFALTLIAVPLFALPALAANGDRLSLSLGFRSFLVSALILAGTSSWGHFRLANTDNRSVAGVKLRIVQPNIKQIDKWRPGNAGPIYQTMLRLSRLSSNISPRGINDITHLIWPESALPFLMARSKEALEGIDDLLPKKVSLITGAMRAEKKEERQDLLKNRVYNSLFVINGDAGIEQIFDKKHLVPFGEYLPFQTLLESLGFRQLTKIRGGFTPGEQPRLIKLGSAPPFSPLICYEVVFPYEIVEKGLRPQWLVNVTNDAWYGISTGPYQHLAQSRIRAIETGLPMVRAANTGVSALINPYGRVEKYLPLASEGILDVHLPIAATETLQARYGHSSFVLLLLTAIIFNLLIALPHTNTPPKKS